MAGLLKAIENGYKPTAREIVDELEQLSKDPAHSSYRFAPYGACYKEEFMTNLLKLLFSSNPDLLRSRTTGVL